MCPSAGFDSVGRFATSSGERPRAVRIWLMGGFRVSAGSTIIDADRWRLKKAAALVKLLALAPGRRLHREQLMDLLWPNSGRQAASNNLRQTLHAARRALDPASDSQYLSSEGEALVLCPGADLWVDAEAFEEAVGRARRSQDPMVYRAALELYAGDLLPEDRYEEWAECKREELRRLYLTLLIEIAGLYEARDEYGLAIEMLRKATAKVLTFEEAHAALMRIHALSGQPEQALDQYERLCDALSGELGTEPCTTTRRLREEIASGSLSSRRPATLREKQLPDTGKHNLPAPRTSFVGRESELVEIKRTLSMTRLLTLTGAGGSGKTRLALEVAKDLVGSYPGGVWLVELAPLSEPGLVTQKLASVLEVPRRPGEPLIDTLVDSLRDKELLLIVDNCEHLVESAAQLMDVLLDSCSRLRVLATSRELLGVDGEVLWQVRPLSTPSIGVESNGDSGAPSVVSLLRYEAVRLYMDRTRLRLPGFGLTRENMGAVVRVCRKLEGIPLAIELATARMGVLAAEQIAQRLETSLGVLKSVSRAAEPRQRTLWATLDWSHDLLSEAERALFRRLSVFAGGWTLEAAEAVCSGGGITEYDILDLLGGLVDKSLVAVRSATTGVAVRYRMLEPTRQYALEKLEENGEADERRGQHAAFFLALAEEAELQWDGPQQRPWTGRLEREHDNLRAALAHSLNQEYPELVLRLAASLSWFWQIRGHLDEGIGWLKEALARGGSVAPTVRANALTGMGAILLERGDFSLADGCLTEALALYEEAGDLARVAKCLVHLGWSAERQSDGVRARGFFEESLAAASKSGDHNSRPGVLLGQGWIAFDSGDFDRARQLWEGAAALDRERGGNEVLASALVNLGYTELARGERQRSTTLLEEALALGRETGSRSVVAASLLSLGIAATLKNEPKQATKLLKEALTIDAELKNRVDIAEDLEGLAGAAGALGEGVRSARLWGAAAALREELDSFWAPAERMLHEPQLLAARLRFGGASWEAAFAEGLTMGLERSIEYALADKEHCSVPTSTRPRESPADQQPTSLTPREQEVAVLVARGFSNRKIADQLFISERTAANHVARILRKLGLRSRARIASWITERGAFARPDPDQASPHFPNRA